MPAPRLLTPPRPAAASRGEAGYNLVILMVAVTVLNILVAATLPLWSQAIKRDKEEELIFRGLQYAEAIRLFRARFQRPPVRLEELIEVKPRCIRQLWTDPMTENGQWKVIFEGGSEPVPGTALTPQPGIDEGDEGKAPAPEEEGGEGDEFNPGKKREITVGPIEGVRSRSADASVLTWFGQNRYDQWQFRWQLVAGGGGQVPPPQGAFGVPNQTPTARPLESIRWLGRPWRRFLSPPGGDLPQGDPSLDPGVKPQPGGKPGGKTGGRAPRPGES